jgi:hypothetical protein
MIKMFLAQASILKDLILRIKIKLFLQKDMKI